MHTGTNKHMRQVPGTHLCRMRREPEVLYHFRKFTRISIPQDATRALSYPVLTDACARNPSAPLRWARRSQHGEHGQHYQHGQTVSRRLWSLPASVVRRGMLCT